jgi:hypothetical protein
MSQQRNRRPGFDVRRHVPALAGALVGMAALWLAVALGSAAVAQRSPSPTDAILEATHLPPLLRLPGERPRLVYDVHCAPFGVEDPERRCEVGGEVFVRVGSRGPFRALPLQPSSAHGIRQLETTVPTELAASRDGFEYYAEIRTSSRPEPLVVPAGGADAPHRSLTLRDPALVGLGEHLFGVTSGGTRLVSARWGDGPGRVGLEQGWSLPAIGASSFDVSGDGTLLLLDEAHRRLLRFERGGVTPTSVPLSIDGRLADIAVDDDSSIYILESASLPRRVALVRHFDRRGRELDVVETAEATPSQIRTGPEGPVVLQHPSHQWMPIADGGVPSAPRDQLRKAEVGHPVGAGRELVVSRVGQEIRAAILASGRVQRSWRVTSETPLAEVQLAEPVGRHLVLVTRVFTDTADEFVVLVLDEQGVVQEFSTPPDEWAEGAPLGRFRLVGTHLYRLGTDASGAFVARYDLEVH